MGGKWAAVAEGVNAPCLQELQPGRNLYAMILGEGIPLTHRLVVRRVQMAAGVCEQGTHRSIAITASKVSAIANKVADVYFISMDLDGILQKKLQHIAIVINNSTVGVCTLIVSDKDSSTEAGLANTMI